jgi:hypothetical protein
VVIPNWLPNAKFSVRYDMTNIIINHIITKPIKVLISNESYIVNKNLATFSGRHGLFTSEVTQTNKFIIGSNFYILQLLCTNHETYEKNLFEKLIAAARVLNITDLLHLIPDNVLETLRWYFQQKYPEHYISKL